MNEMSWRTKTFLIGGMTGAVLGLCAAYLYVTSVEREGAEPELQPSAYFAPQALDMAAHRVFVFWP